MFPRGHYWRDWNLFVDEARTLVRRESSVTNDSVAYQNHYGHQQLTFALSNQPARSAGIAYRFLPTLQVKPGVVSAGGPGIVPYVLWWRTTETVHPIRVQQSAVHFHHHHHHHHHHYHNYNRRHFSTGYPSRQCRRNYSRSPFCGTGGQGLRRSNVDVRSFGLPQRRGMETR